MPARKPPTRKIPPAPRRRAHYSSRCSNPDVAPLLLSVPDAARTLGIGVCAVWSHLKAGDIGHVREGRRVLIPRTALEAYVNAAERRGYEEEGA